MESQFVRKKTEKVGDINKFVRNYKSYETPEISSEEYSRESRAEPIKRLFSPV